LRKKGFNAGTGRKHSDVARKRKKRTLHPTIPDNIKKRRKKTTEEEGKREGGWDCLYEWSSGVRERVFYVVYWFGKTEKGSRSGKKEERGGGKVVTQVEGGRKKKGARHCVGIILERKGEFVL